MLNARTPTCACDHPFDVAGKFGNFLKSTSSLLLPLLLFLHLFRLEDMSTYANSPNKNIYSNNFIQKKRNRHPKGTDISYRCLFVSVVYRNGSYALD